MALFSNHTDTATDIISKAAPPIAVSGLTMFGFSIPELVQLITLVYVSVMLIDKVYTMYSRYRDKSNESSE
jgi:hypothetical protein